MSGSIAKLLQEQAGNSVYNQSYVGELTKKWAPFLKGINNEHTTKVMSVLYENQAQYLNSLTEETRTTNVGSFLKYVFPVLRRVNYGVTLA